MILIIPNYPIIILVHNNYSEFLIISIILNYFHLFLIILNFSIYTIYSKSRQ